MSKKAEAIYMASPVWLQSLLVSGMGYRLYRKRYGGLYQQLLEQVRESREWTRAQRENWQNQQLHQMVKHCRTSVPYYQKLFAEHGLHENDITSLSDLHKLPVLDKQTVRENASELRCAGEEPWVVQHTSGSTGTPLALQVNEHTYKLAMALVVDHEEHHGIPFGARRATFAGRMVQQPENMHPPFARYNRAENQMLFSSYHLNTDTFQWYADELKRFRPRELIGYPSAISDLAYHYLDAGISPGFKPDAVITNSETLLAWQRELIEKAFNCPVYDYYGTAEYVVFAGQEPDGRYRLNPILGVTEVLNDSREPSLEGSLVATTLTNRVMPLLRYEVGDSGMAVSEGMTASVVYQLERINGRMDDYIEMPDGRRIGRLDHVFKGITAFREAQIVQNSRKTCTVYVVTSGSLSSDLESRIKHNFHARVGRELSISVERINEIPRSSNGKFKNVVRSFT